MFGKLLFSNLKFPGLFFDADGGGNGDPANKDEKPEGEKPKGKEYTQDELNAMFAERAKRGGEKATADLLAELEVENLDSLKELIKDAKAAKAANQTEIEKAAGEAKKAAEKLAQVEAEKKANEEKLQGKLLAAEIKFAATSREKPFRADAVDDIVLLLDRSKIKLNEDGTYEGIVEALNALAEAKPWMLDDGTPKEPEKGTPKGQAKKNPKQQPTSEDNGKRPAATL